MADESEKGLPKAAFYFGPESKDNSVIGYKVEGYERVVIFDALAEGNKMVGGHALRYQEGHPQEDVYKLIDDLRLEISKLSAKDQDNNDSLVIIEELERQIESNEAKRPIIRGLLSALPAVESITAIGATIMSVIPWR